MISCGLIVYRVIEFIKFTRRKNPFTNRWIDLQYLIKRKKAAQNCDRRRKRLHRQQTRSSIEIYSSLAAGAGVSERERITWREKKLEINKSIA